MAAWKTGDLSGLETGGPIPVQQIEGQRNPQGAVSIATVAVHPQNPDSIYLLAFRQDQRGYFRREALERLFAEHRSLAQDHGFRPSRPRQRDPGFQQRMAQIARTEDLFRDEAISQLEAEAE